VEAAERIWRTVRIAGSDLSEREVVPCSALAVGGRVQKVAVRHVVPVDVVPRPRRAGSLIVRRDVHRGDVVWRKAAQRGPESRLAIAKQIVGETQPRAEVLEVRG